MIKKTLAHRQATTEFLLAQSEKAIALGVRQWDLSAPDMYMKQFESYYQYNKQAKYNKLQGAKKISKHDGVG